MKSIGAQLKARNLRNGNVVIVVYSMLPEVCFHIKYLKKKKWAAFFLNESLQEKIFPMSNPNVVFTTSASLLRCFRMIL